MLKFAGKAKPLPEGVTTLSITTLRIMALSIRDSRHKGHSIRTLPLCWSSLCSVSYFIFCYGLCHYIGCCYTECQYAECHLPEWSPLRRSAL